MSDPIKELLQNTYRDVCVLAFDLHRDERLQTPDGRNFGADLVDAIEQAVAQVTGEVLSKSDEAIFEEAIRKLMAANEATREHDRFLLDHYEDVISARNQEIDRLTCKLQDACEKFNGSCDCKNVKKHD